MQKKLIATFLVLTSTAWADVNMKDAAYLKTMNEFKTDWLERTYSSRSLWKGTFGFGWCARFEKKLKVLNSEKGLLQSCDRETLVPLKIKNGLWIYETPQNRETYDQQGRLVASSKSKARFSYNSQGLLSEINVPSEKWLLFYQDKTGTVQDIRSSKNFKVSYEQSHGDLSLVKAGSQKIHLKYDSVHNLIEVQSPREKESITYQEDRDEVASFKSSRQICHQTFQFEKISSMQLKSTVFNICPSAPVSKKIYTFTARRDPQGRTILSNLRISGDENDKTFLP
jgi:YD repeat-containing protein